MSVFSNIASYYVSDDKSGKCVVNGNCRFLGVQVARESLSGSTKLQVYDQGGTVGSSATPSAGNLVITLDFFDEGNKERTPYYMILPRGTSVKMDDGIVVELDGGNQDLFTVTVFYQQ
tara:strand:- start:537 stop:890 length:354 start_codon:yes stop_codon:yes gene_type:complete